MRTFALSNKMAVAVAAHPVVPATARALCRGATQIRNGAEPVSVLVPVSTSFSRLESVRGAGKLAFGRDLPGCNGYRSHCSVRVRASQPSLEAVPVPAGYQTVKSRLEAERPDLPVGKNGRDDEDLLLWFLRDRKFDVDAAVEKITTALVWRKEFGVDEITKDSISRAAASGEAYLHTSLSKDGKPVIVVTSAKHFPNDAELPESQRHCVYLIEKALSQLPPGCETFLGIFDLRGFKQKNGDLKFTKFLIDAFFKYYPKRLGQVLFVDAPFIFQPGWAMIKPLVGKYAALVRFCSADEVRNDYFTLDTIPESFKQ
nr:phosphatidylinositol transfer protein CSR1-like isoform X2 [Physcomitrium patens]|eukprot:XP_024399664.1 phosphatidylinositol transfer protein CSR1-like isoform X2 [Physcomitrella patens]